MLQCVFGGTVTHFGQAGLVGAQVGVDGCELDIEGGDVRVYLEVARVSVMQKERIAGSCIVTSHQIRRPAWGNLTDIRDCAIEGRFRCGILRAEKAVHYYLLYYSEFRLKRWDLL